MLRDVEGIKARIVFCLIFLCLSVIKILTGVFPPLARAIDEKLKKKNPSLSLNHVNWTKVVCMTHFKTLDLFKPAVQGAPPVDVILHTLEGSIVHLMDRVRPGRPLVVNMGSCS